MKKFQLFILSLFIVLITFSSFDSMAQKKKRKCFLRKKDKVETKVTTKTDDTQIVVREPGVPNRQAYDSLKKDLMYQKRMSNALVVSFISMSAGIDAKSAKQLETMIADFNKQYKADLFFEKKTWGREGERDYCIISANADWVNKFAMSVKKTFEGNRLIFVKENSPCRN